jgi:hypothetical protein
MPKDIDISFNVCQGCGSIVGVAINGVWKVDHHEMHEEWHGSLVSALEGLKRSVQAILGVRL